MQVDVAIVGAGPAGLCFARSLADSGLSVAIIERQEREALVSPAFDGREIAMTHESRRILEELGIWQQVQATGDISPMLQADVMDGPSPFTMSIHSGTKKSRKDLGWFLPNYRIREAAYAVVADQKNLQWFDGKSVVGVEQDLHVTRVKLSDGQQIEARLLVAADSRFSETRRMIGIGAQMRDFGKTMLVTRIQHERPNHQIAWEWFGYGQTLALLPLKENLSSVVVTLPQVEINKLMAMDDETFGAEMERRYEGRLGKMTSASTRHAYPLVGVYSNKFTGHRYALIGDAAVGMHPVTAHGFNLGLQSQHTLAKQILAAVKEGRDVADPKALANYEFIHRKDSLPLFLATLTVVSLFTTDNAPARMVRSAILRVAGNLPPFKKAIAWHLTRGKQKIA